MKATNDLEKKEATAVDTVERTRSRRVFVPRVDIYETDKSIELLADMPGIDEKMVDITLEKNVLTIVGHVEPVYPEGYNLVYSEYEIGDFERSFTLTDQIDQDQISAKVKNGVLRLSLPKSGKALSRKIEVKLG